MQQAQKQQFRDIEELFSYKIINKFYKTGDVIAQGGYGHIFYGEDFDGKPKAIKVIDMQKIIKTKNEKLIRQIEQQPQAMMACNNPYVMKCECVLNSEEQKIKLIVMDYCDYGSLEDLIYLRCRLPQQEARIILKQMLYALGDVHRHRRVHRDIKPANFVGKGDSIIMCDFGCSRIFVNFQDRNSLRKTYQQPATIVGTSCYMSPQMLNQQQYGRRTDIWGIGLVFYEMLTGTFPFEFSEGMTKKDIRVVIEKSLNEIYDHEYISKKLKKQGLDLSPESCVISPSAKSMLKQLLCFDKDKRIGWDQLLSHHYLINQSEICHKKYYQRQGCSFPLKNIDWKKVKKELQQQLMLNNQEIFENQYQSEQIIIFQIKDLDYQQKYRINKKSGNKYDKFLQNININREIHFEVRRIILLMQSRQELSRFDQTKINLARAISLFCYLKITEIIKIYEKKLDKLFFESYELNQLKTKVEEVANIDKKELQIENNRWFKNMLNLRGREKKKMLSVLCDSKDIIQVSEVLINLAKKLKKQIKANKISTEIKKHSNLRQLIQNSEFMISRIYVSKIEPDKRQRWNKWENLREFRKNNQIFSLDPTMKDLIETLKKKSSQQSV